MSETVVTPFGETLRSIDELQERNKYLVGPVNRYGRLAGEVTDYGSLFFFKKVKDSQNASVRADLENEVRWNQTVGPKIVGYDFSVPRVITHARDFEWAIFEYIDGRPPREAELERLVMPAVADITASLFQLPLDREGSDLAGWYANRLGRFTSVTAGNLFGLKAKEAVEKLATSKEPLGKLTAGIIHGDMNPKNLLVVKDEDEHISLTDAEFGTLPQKPEWDKPRLHDMAYFYHLLRCQYHRPDLAENFRAMCWQNLRSEMSEENFTIEFELSVLERTISMMSHFVINRSASAMIDDKRRLVPEPYVETIGSSLEAIAT